MRGMRHTPAPSTPTPGGTHAVTGGGATDRRTHPCPATRPAAVGKRLTHSVACALGAAASPPGPGRPVVGPRGRRCARLRARAARRRLVPREWASASATSLCGRLDHASIGPCAPATRTLARHVPTRSVLRVMLNSCQKQLSPKAESIIAHDALAVQPRCGISLPTWHER